VKYVFGPVPSRRLGRSLGIDPLPLKTCDLSCVYCQLGRTHPLVVGRKEYVPAEEIVSEVEETLARLRPGSVDWLTFVGSGETTLHSRLGWMIRRLRTISDLPIAVITNGSLLHRGEMHRELAGADAVLPSLDAASDPLFDTINRPHRSLRVEQIIGGLSAFRRQYEGRLWLEVMLVRGLNDSEEALTDLAEALRRIQPDEVQINVPTRPPAEAWVWPPERSQLDRAVSILGGVSPVVVAGAGGRALRLVAESADHLVGIIRRHPLRQDEVLSALEGWSQPWAQEALAELAASDEVTTVDRLGTRFWCSADARFPRGGEAPRRGTSEA